MSVCSVMLCAAAWGCSEPSAADEQCDRYCDEEFTFCTGSNAQFSNREECEASCAAYSRGGTEGDKKGDTLECRFTHLGFASGVDGDPITHCPHTGASGAGVCVNSVSPCAQYCNLIQETCNISTTQQYESVESCVATCATFRTADETTGNTVTCHLNELVRNPEQKSLADQCRDAGSSSFVCVDPD